MQPLCARPHSAAVFDCIYTSALLTLCRCILSKLWIKVENYFPLSCATSADIEIPATALYIALSSSPCSTAACSFLSFWFFSFSIISDNFLLGHHAARREMLTRGAAKRAASSAGGKGRRPQCPHVGGRAGNQAPENIHT